MANVAHGGALDLAIARHGGTRGDWLDLSTGINPVAYPAGIQPQDIWCRLPDTAAMDRCLAAARVCFAVPDGADIIAGPGSQAFIQRLPLMCGDGDVSIVGDVTYGEYENRLAYTGRTVRRIADLPENPGEADTIVLCHPNNPDGGLISREPLLGLADRTPERQGAIVVDEAFGDVAPEHSFVSMAGRKSFYVIRSFGKFFGLAGLRLGFLIGQADDLRRIADDLGPWAVSGPALAIGAEALADAEWITATRMRLQADRKALQTLLKEAGFAIAGGTDLFVLASHPDSTDIAKALAQNHILVRTFEQKPDWIRFALPAGAGQLERLRSALAAATS